MKRARSRAHKKKLYLFPCACEIRAPQRHRCWPCAPGNIFSVVWLASIKLCIIGLVLVREAAADTDVDDRTAYVWHVGLLHISKAHKDNRHIQNTIFNRVPHVQRIFTVQYKRRKICF